ncbi:alpha/beta fold hydrolase [Nocardioides marmorisolisilvae]|uniref:Alpha/beta fold hydrolase n=2 Tax=Nocardioides marmorisolisilvae TaxID=1542737 RepID=A0A3N0DIL4_9ACTN|nr:alpha/beta fold hydrolase [Nocardioides marmorisolisilvae]
MWSNVVPLLDADYEVFALTAAGHRGGRPARPGTTVRDLVDDAERSLDDLGLERPHLVGNSLGGWIALELARRGRAASVCALSPAGCWDIGTGEHLPGAAKLEKAITLALRTRWVMPMAAHLPWVRRLALRDSASHGERVSAAELKRLVDDLVGCTIREEMLTTEEYVAPMDPLPCPVTLAWSELDRILPMETIGARARVLMPEATWKVLPGVGHVPMFDDPDLVAATIRECLESIPSNAAE